MSTVNSSAESDVRKKGFLKKIKTMKRKLFILREDSQFGPARLEYYDSDKKFKSGNVPKRSIELKSCFNINKNKKGDQKHKYAIDLYTKDDCFSIGCDNEEEQESWLTTMLELQNDDVEEGTPPRPVFEHIWQVTIKNRGLGNGKMVSPGVYRLCLTNKTLSLVKHTQSETDIVFQLASIRRCGHTDCFFLLEVGSYTCTGAGELWMQVEDTVIAQNMHETILSSMKNKDKAQQDFIPYRSRTKTNELKKPSPKAVIRCNTMTATDRPSDPRGKISSRPKTVIYNPGHSPSRGSPLDSALPEQRPRAGSMESGGAASSDYDTSPGSGAGSTSSIPSGDTDYFPMTPNRDVTPLYSRDGANDGYMPMAPNSHNVPVISNEDVDQSGYVLHKSTGESSIDTIRQSCSTSPALSTCSSTDGGLMDVQTLRRSLPTVQEKTSNDYADMGQDIFRNSSQGQRLDKVASYYTDDGFPTRCYSVGSKPEKPNKPLDESYMSMDMSKGQIDKGNPKASSAPHLTEKEERLQSESAARLRGSREIDQDDLLLIDYRDSSTSSLTSGDSFSSRPRSASGGKDMRPRLSSAGKDFRKRASSFGKDGIPRTASFGPSEAHRPRTATIGGDSMRPRTSSFNATDMRPRSSSHGNNYNIFKRKKDNSLIGSDLLRKTVMSQHDSRESLKSQSSTDYIDMGRKVTKARDKHRQVEEQMSDYMGMTPGGGDNTEQDYMNFDHTSHKSNKSEKSSVKGAINISSQKQVTKPKSRGHSSGTLLTVGSPNTRSSSESLSSQASYGSDVSGRRSTGPIDEAGDMGEYVDLDYSDKKKSTQKERSKAKKSSKSGKSRESPDAKTLLQQISKEARTSGAKVTQAEESYVAYEPGNGNEISSKQTPPIVTLAKVSSPIQMDVDTCDGSGFMYDKTVPQKPAFGNVLNFVPSDPMGLTTKSSLGTSHATSSSRKQCPSPLQAVASRIQGRSPSPKRSRTSSKSPVFGEKKSDPLAVNVVMASSLTRSKGSISSLSPSDTITGFTTRGSSGSLSSMDTLQSGPSSPRGLLTDPKTTRSATDCSAYENMTFEKKGGRNSSNSSLNENKQLVYASLDLSAKNEEGSQRPVSPGALGRGTPATAEMEDMPLDYAQIDFKKSEGLKNTSFKENRFPFDVKK